MTEKAIWLQIEELKKEIQDADNAHIERKAALDEQLRKLLGLEAVNGTAYEQRDVAMSEENLTKKYKLKALEEIKDASK